MFSFSASLLSPLRRFSRVNPFLHLSSYSVLRSRGPKCHVCRSLMFTACTAPCAQEAIRPAQQLPGAALRPDGLHLRSLLLLSQGTSQHFALPESAALRPEGLHLRSNARSAMNSPHSQPLAFGAASCILRLQRFDAPRLSSRPPLHSAAVRRR